MPLTPATRLGPYEIIAPLGAGGMHASIVTTQRYARLSDEAVRREAERLVSWSRNAG